MSREWKPGDVAMVERPSGGERVSVMIGHDPADRCWHSTESNGDLSCLAAEAVPARPLVVIDPDDREQVERLYKSYATTSAVNRADAMQAALREFASPTPPKPEEPLGLGAVVEAIYDNHFIHVGNGGWQRVEKGHPQGAICTYAEIAVVRVLSPGYTEGDA